SGGPARPLRPRRGRGPEGRRTTSLPLPSAKGSAMNDRWRTWMVAVLVGVGGVLAAREGGPSTTLLAAALLSILPPEEAEEKLAEAPPEMRALILDRVKRAREGFEAMPEEDHDVDDAETDGDGSPGSPCQCGGDRNDPASTSHFEHYLAILSEQRNF